MSDFCRGQKVRIKGFEDVYTYGEEVEDGYIKANVRKSLSECFYVPEEILEKVQPNNRFTGVVGGDLLVQTSVHGGAYLRTRNNGYASIHVADVAGLIEVLQAIQNREDVR